LTAVVTGSSSGIGRAIALALAAGGADVLVHARANRDAAGDVARAIQELGRQSDVVLCDLVDAPAQDQLADRAWQWRRGVDVWVNNAGADVLTGDAARQSFDEKLRRLWAVDVQATIRLGRNIGQRMKQRGSGVILNLGWDQAETGMAGDSGEMFAAVKGAIMAFSRSLAQSLAPEVRVNCLAPGWIKTSWGERASAAWQQRASRESLLGRWGTPQDVARAARFLVSPAAEFITGQIVAVNGGLRRGSED
jgi:3-oxoacyl-[acyl-carrier protein] reductase